MDVAVAISARKPRHARLLEVDILALAPAQEGAHTVVNLGIQLRVVFIAVVSIKQQRLVVVGYARAIRSRKGVQHGSSEGIQALNRYRRTGGIHDFSQWI